MSNKFLNTKPCPIPNCALEYFLAGLLISIGIYISQFGMENAIRGQAQLEWGLFIGMPGLIQLGVLLKGREWLQYVISFWVSAICLITTIFLHKLDPVPVLAGVFVMITIGEILVFALLRGAKWKSPSSQNSSNASVGDG